MSEQPAVVLANDVNVTMAFACENFSQDAQQRLYFHTVIDQINAMSFPATSILFMAIFGFQRQLAGFLMQCEVDIVGESGDPINSQKVPDVVFKPGDLNSKSIIGFVNTVWPKPGNYVVRFRSRGAVIASFLLKLNLMIPGSEGKA